MFLRVMIVDDEYLIRNLIRMRLNWEEYGMEIVAEAGSAAQALELMLQYRPDIVFTDISMPDMNGIEFSRQVNSQFPGTRIVIITGYDEFEYARQSLELGVVDYLLKPVKYEELKDVVERLVALIGDEQARMREIRRMRELLETNRPVLRERFLCSLMMEAGSTDEIDRQFSYFELPLQADAPMEVAVIDVQQPENTSEEYRLLLETQCGSIAQKYCGDTPAFVFSDYWRRIVLLRAYDPERADVYEGLRDVLRDAVHCQVAMGVGGPVCCAAQVHQSYAQACDALHYRVVAGDNQVIYYEDIVPGRPSVENEDGARVEKLMFYVRAGAAPQMTALLDEIMAHTSAPGGQSGQALHQARMKAMDIVAASQHLTSEDSAPAGSEALSFLFAGTLPEIRAGLAGYLQALADDARRIVAKKNDSLVSRAKAYISEHMAEEDLRLATVADSLFISAGHLSRLIKQETGRTFVEYLTDIRVKRATELLRSTSLKGYEVGERVGIHDPHYFCILFKKSTGMSVNKFRGGEGLGDSTKDA